MRLLRRWCALALAMIATLVTCQSTQGGLVDTDWDPVLHFDWWISDAGGGAIDLMPQQQGEGVWRLSGYFGDTTRVMTWSLEIDLTSGHPTINVLSLVAKNYSLVDAQFHLSVDMNLDELLDPGHRLLGNLHLILAGVDGTVSTNKDDGWLWSLRADYEAAAGVFIAPWSLYVEQGGVEAFGGIDLPAGTAPTEALGFGLNLGLTSGEAVYMTGLVAVPAPGGLLLFSVLLGGGRRRPVR